MTRRTLLAIPFAMRLRADAKSDVWDLLSEAAHELNEGDDAAFMDCFDKKMPGYEELRADVQALVREAPPPSGKDWNQRGGIYSSIELVADQGDDQARSLEVDWILDIRQTNGALGATRRQQRVKLRTAKTGKKWRIVAFEPARFFAPPDSH
jgi:hypothetical protein